MMNVKFFGFDLDGTLLNKDNQVLESTIHELKKINDKGHIIALVSGRGVIQSIPILKKLRENGIEAKLIGNNGSIIKDGIDGENEFLGTVSKNASRWIIEKGRETNSLVIVHFDGNTVYYIDEFKWLDEINRLGAGVNINPHNIGEYHELEAAIETGKVNQATIKQASHKVQEITKDVPNDLLIDNDLVIVGGVYMDFVPKNINKFNSVITLCERYNIKREDIYLFGDSLNDISMMRDDVNSIAMKNGLEIIKSKAKYITKYDNNNDGIAHWIKNNVHI